MKEYEKYLDTIIEHQDIDALTFVVDSKDTAQKVVRHLTRALKKKDMRQGISLTICTQPTGFTKVYKVKMTRCGSFARPRRMLKPRKDTKTEEQ